jgi:hypothetical protein
MLEVNSKVTRGNKNRLLELAVTTVKGYHLPRYKTEKPNKTKIKNEKLFEAQMKNAKVAKKRAETLRRVAGNKNTGNSIEIGRMIPTAMRLRVNNKEIKTPKEYQNYVQKYHEGVPNRLKNNRDGNENFLRNPKKYNYVLSNKNKKGEISIYVRKKNQNSESTGMNTTNEGVMRLRPGEPLKKIPWQWSCPIPAEMQSHQYTGAITSTRLGNDSNTNPTKVIEKYVPTGQLLYHSAGSGKTLLMLLTVFFWMMKWWGAPSVYTLPRSSNNIKQRGICKMIIFISETAQVKELKGQNGMDLFMNIMNKVSSNKSSDALLKFHEKWREFENFLPEKKVVLKFSPKPQPDSKMTQVPRYPENMSYGKVKSWRGEGIVAIICKGNHPFFRKSTKTMGLIRGKENEYTKFTKPAETNRYKWDDEGTNFYPQGFNLTSSKGRELKKEFAHSWRGYGQLNVYLQNVTYAYSVIKMNSKSNANVLNNQSAETKSYCEIYEDYRAAKGAYHLFTEEMIVQLYSRVKVFLSTSAAQFSLAGPDGMSATDGMRLHYKNIQDPDSSDQGLVQILSEGDFIRFRVGNSKPQQEMNFTNESELSELREACGDHWKEWAEVNLGGVSPFYKVMGTKTIKYKKGSKDAEFTFIKLQRMLIHPFTKPGSAFDPIYNGNADEVQSDKQSSTSKTVLHSNIKKGFQIYDLVRPSYEPQAVDPIETFCDSADMRTAQQSLPSQALKLILANSGAELRDNTTYQLAPKEKPDGSSDWGATNAVKMDKVGLASSNLWWMSYGEHEHWTGGEADRAAKWDNLKEATNGTLKKPPSGEDFLGKLKDKLIAAPKMPDTLLLGMTSQMALQLFHKLPEGALYIVDEIQKYVGNQDKPSKLSSINNVIERQNFYCMLSEAVKPKDNVCAADKNNTRGATNNKNIFKNNNNTNKKPTSKVENYEVFCQRAAALANNPSNRMLESNKDPFLLLPHMKPLKGTAPGSARKFTKSSGGGYIQGASATPSIIDLNTKASNSNSVNELERPVNELERMWRLIGSCRNQVITPINRGMLKTGREITMKSGKKVTQNIGFIKKAYRKKMQRWLQDSKILISFIDLSMDVTKVPLSTTRGTDSISKSTSVVEVDLDIKNRKKRLHVLNFGTSKSVEDRIGYPTMDVQNNNAPAKGTKKPTTKSGGKTTTEKATKKPTTKSGGKTTTEKATKTKKASSAPKGARDWGDNISDVAARYKAGMNTSRQRRAEKLV